MNIHFIGCLGVSMKSLAKIWRHDGHNVSGSDIALHGHDKNNVIGKDLVVYSGAIGVDNEEFAFAKQLGVPMCERAEFLAATSAHYERTIAIAGCHGKTTTTAMLSEIMRPFRPTAHIGGDYDDFLGDDKKYFITEACEYRKSFLCLSPTVGVITNIDFDHPDTYRDIGEVEQAFCAFAKNCKSLIYCGDDPICRRVLPQGTTFGFSSENDYVVKELDAGNFDLFFHGTYCGTYRLQCAGKFNMLNAAAAVVTSMEEGIGYRTAVEGLARFSGVKRRGEIIRSTSASTIISDYSHHPAEIEARISELKRQYKTVAVIFQPHTYSRTQALLERFVRAFDAADYVAITETFAARGEHGDDRLLYRELDLHRKCDFVCRQDVPALCGKLSREYSCVAVMGAGDVQKEL